MANDPQYSWVYKELVDGSDDVRGALAYVLYKNAKIAYIENFAKANGKQPSEAELTEFHRMTSLSETLEGYRERADVLLEAFLDNVLAEQLALFKADMRFDEAVNNIKSEVGGIKSELRVDEVIRAIKPKFMTGVWQNIVAGLVTTLITFGFVLGAWMYNEGPAKIMAGAANKMLGTDAQAAPPLQSVSQPQQARSRP